MASVEFARERLFRIRLLLFIHHSDDHKTANERVRHLVQGIPELLGLVGPGLSIGLCVERGSPALHAAHVEMRPPRMMRCALPFLCSFRPSRNLGHVEASSTYEPPSTLGVRQGATCDVHLGLQISCKLQQELLLLQVAAHGDTRTRVSSTLAVPVRPRPRAVARITIFTDLRPQIIYLRQRHHSRHRPHTPGPRARHHTWRVPETRESRP